LMSAFMYRRLSFRFFLNTDKWSRSSRTKYMLQLSLCACANICNVLWRRSA
jgi:hypothetical protein